MIVIAAKPFTERLQIVLQRGNLRVADLARLFDRPHSTVLGWVKRRLNPAGGPTDVDAAYIMLGKIESHIARGKMLPVPPNLPPVDRIRHINKLRGILLGAKSP